MDSKRNYSTRSGQIPSRKLHSHNQLADSTAYFREVDVFSLNISFSDIDHADNFHFPVEAVMPSEILISDRTGESLISCLKDEGVINDLPRKEKTFAMLLAYVLINETATRGTEESRTDSLVDQILRTLEFNEYPLMLQLQPLYKFSVYNKEITSKFDFGITKNGKIAMIDEDKHFGNTGPSYAWGEYQIAGEMLTGASYNYSLTGHSDDLVFAVRVIGTRFTFYKTKVSTSYLNSLAEGLPTEEEMIIYRYPSRNTQNKLFPNFDFSIPKERRIIVDMLLRIREYLLG